MNKNKTETKPETADKQEIGGDCPSATCSEIFSCKTLPADGEQVVCIRGDGWWGKGAWYKRYNAWMVDGQKQDIVFWMRVFLPNA